MDENWIDSSVEKTNLVRKKSSWIDSSSISATPLTMVLVEKTWWLNPDFLTFSLTTLPNIPEIHFENQMLREKKLFRNDLDFFFWVLVIIFYLDGDEAKHCKTCWWCKKTFLLIFHVNILFWFYGSEKSKNVIRQVSWLWSKYIKLIVWSPVSIIRGE